MKKRILSLFLAFSLAAGIGVVGAGNTSEAAISSNNIFSNQANVSLTDTNTVYWELTAQDMLLSSASAIIGLGTGGAQAASISDAGILLTQDTAAGYNDNLGITGNNAPYVSGGGTDWSWKINSDSGLDALNDINPGVTQFQGTVTDGWFLTKPGTGNWPLNNTPLKVRVKVPNGAFVTGANMSVASVASMNGAIENGKTFFTEGTGKLVLPKGNYNNNWYYVGYANNATNDGGIINNTNGVNSFDAISAVSDPQNNTNGTYDARRVQISGSTDIYVFDYSEVLGTSNNFSHTSNGNMTGMVWSSKGGYGAATRINAGGSYQLPTVAINGISMNAWDEIDPRTGNILNGRSGITQLSAADNPAANTIRVFKLRGAASTTTNAYLSGTYTFGETVKASAGLTSANARVEWSVARFNAAGQQVGSIIPLRSGTGRNFYELVIKDVYDATLAGNEGYNVHEWNWNVLANGSANEVLSPALRAAGDTWRIRYVATENGRTYTSNWSTIERKILDRRDFVYGSAGESYTTWETGANNNESNVIDPQFRENNANVLVKLNNLNMQGYSFDIRYRDASQALDVNKGSQYDLSYQTGEGAQDYGYQFMTGEQLRTNGQAGRYGVYVVGVYQDAASIAAGTVAGNARANGTNGTVNNGTTDNMRSTVANANMFRVNQNTQTNAQVAQWGYALKDDDKATTLGDKSAGANVPALFIGTLNVGKAKWPAAANAHPVATLENIYNGNNSSGYIVGSKFRAEEVGIPTRYKMLDTFEWFRVDDSDNWTSTGKTGATYTASADDVGYRIGVKVSNANYEGTIQGETHQVIGKQSIDVNFTTGSQYREGHFTPGGKMVVDLRSDLKNFGKALGDVEFDMSGHGTFESGKYIAENNSLEFTFRDVTTVPSTFAPYKVNAVVEFPGFNVAVKGDVRGTANDVTTVVIEPIEDKTYDGVAVSTTAKAYVNGEEVSDGSQVTVTYSGNTNGPKDAGSYVATASYKGATATAAFKINKVKLAPSDKFPREYGIERALPVDLTGFFPQIVNGDNINIHNYVTKYEFKYDTTPGFEENAATPNGQRLSKVFYTPTFDIGNWEYYVQFVPVGMSGDWTRNYEAPDPVKIKVGTGYVNASSSNISNNEPYAEQVARVNAKWKEGSVHRMVLAGGGDYLYTSSKKEALYNVRTGEWTFDDVLFKGVAEGTVGAKELVRLDNKGQRVTTIKDSKEYNYLLEKGYVDNGRIAFVYTEKADGAVPYNRLYYPKTGTHMLQNPDNNEFKVLIDGGSWKDEGTQFYAPQG